MTDYFAEAEGLLKPQRRPAGYKPRPVVQTDMAPADKAAAQVQATLAVASQLARIATALERLAGGQKGAGSGSGGGA